MSQGTGHSSHLNLTVVNLILAGLLSASLFVSFFIGAGSHVFHPGPDRGNRFPQEANTGDELDIAALQTDAKRRTFVERVKKEKGDQAVVIDVLNLDLAGMELKQEDFITLSSMQGLRKLNLAKTTIKDPDLQHIALLSNLEFLDLSATSITDMGIQHVRKLGNLRQLVLEETKVTAARVRELHEEMPGIHARLYGHGADISEHAVQPRIGKFVLVKSGLERVAFKFTATTKRGDGGAKFVWYRQTDIEAKFNKEPMGKGEGEVFEKYRRVNSADGKNWVENDGGELQMHVGQVALEWSKPFTVYFPDNWNNPPRVQMALTSWERVEDINFGSNLVKWYERTDGR